MDLTFCKLQLALVREYEFSAVSNKDDGWKGVGRGTVRSEEDGSGSILFFEEGFFENARGRFKSHNTYRWKFNYLDSSISLEHLRFGADKPVYLFDMVYDKHNLWSSQCPHLCDRDEYHAKMIIDRLFIKLDWDILKKEDFNRIEYTYFF